MYPIKQSTAITVPFFCHDASGDAVTGLTSVSFTKRISKNGAAFGAMTVTITEMENGWYSIPLSATHSDTTGLLTITFTNAGCKQVNLQWRVETKLNDDLNDLAAGAEMDLVNAPNATAVTAIQSGLATTAAVGDIPNNAEFDAKIPNALNTTALGNIGIDWANVENPTSIQNLSATNIDVDQVVASVSGQVATLGTLPTIPTDWLTADGTAADFTTEVTGSIPTATENADALLNRDMSAVSDTTARSPLNALRFLRNKWSVTGTTLTVTKEDDTTAGWTATVTTNAAADPITGNDPA